MVAVKQKLAENPIEAGQILKARSIGAERQERNRKTLEEMRARKKKNSTAADFRQHQTQTLKDLSKMFQGRANGEKQRVLESDYTPKDKGRLGTLVQIKVKDGGRTIPIDFDGEAFLSMDLRKNLHISGKDSRVDNIKLPAKGHLRYLGELVQVDYITNKKHIENDKTVRFFHKLGEVTKECPNLFVDDEGFLHIQGGGYDIWDVGIVN